MNIYKKLIFNILFILFSSFTSLSSVENNQYHVIAKNELKSELMNYLNFFISNGYVNGAEKLSAEDIEVVLENILNNKDVIENVLPVVYYQVVNRAAKDINSNTLRVNKIVDLYSKMTFFTSVFFYSLVGTFFVLSEEKTKEDVYSFSSITSKLSSFGIIIGSFFSAFSAIWEQMLLYKKDEVVKNGTLLKEKKSDLSNFLMNILINEISNAVAKNIALEDKTEK
jgi:hypothetical protein